MKRVIAGIGLMALLILIIACAPKQGTTAKELEQLSDEELIALAEKSDSPQALAGQANSLGLSTIGSQKLVISTTKELAKRLKNQIKDLTAQVTITPVVDCTDTDPGDRKELLGVVTVNLLGGGVLTYQDSCGGNEGEDVMAYNCPILQGGECVDAGQEIIVNGIIVACRYGQFCYYGACDGGTCPGP